MIEVPTLAPCTGCKDLPIHKVHVDSKFCQQSVWGRAPCGEWFCEGCIDHIHPPTCSCGEKHTASDVIKTTFYGHVARSHAS
jgi:hypothetical protein